ncbi:hypothetical protein ABZW18_17115 [Streptomyces sp. NPDC004647]|uniref:hypothetical protein n=1 Tax=Streptomyces sp. NPDC004647 TaxID=3154671 RepID=UPI0033A0EE0B
MGSLRNPVGPLPSSIYWRRRAVALSLVALLSLLIVWAVNSGGSGGGDGQGKGPDADGPASSITPGPSSSGPAVSERPGGRDESEGGGSGGGTGGGTGGGPGGGTGGGAGDDGEGGDGGATGGADGSGGSGSGGGIGVPAGSSLPDCTSGATKLTVRSVKNSYAPGDKPKFEIVAKNSSGKSCKLDFGDKAAVLTITLADDDDPMWASDDCPKHSRMLLQVPAEGESSRTVEWDRKPSEPECATPSAGSAKPGTYLVEVKPAGLPTARVSFSLAKD